MLRVACCVKRVEIAASEENKTRSERRNTQHVLLTVSLSGTIVEAAQFAAASLHPQPDPRRPEVARRPPHPEPAHSVPPENIDPPRAACSPRRRTRPRPARAHGTCRHISGPDGATQLGDQNV